MKKNRLVIVVILFILLITIVFIYVMFTYVNTSTTDKGVKIDGIVWATRNVGERGTFVGNPEDYGNHYLWDVWGSQNAPPIGWRVPTVAELKKLEASSSQWTTQNGINGLLFGSGNNLLFLPAAGFRDCNTYELLQVGVVGKYWSSKVNDDGIPVKGNYAYALEFSANFSSPTFYNESYYQYGCNVRCVKLSFFSAIKKAIMPKNDKSLLSN